MYPSRDVTFISTLMNSFVLYVKRSIVKTIFIINPQNLDQIAVYKADYSCYNSMVYPAHVPWLELLLTSPREEI